MRQNFSFFNFFLPSPLQPLTSPDLFTEQDSVPQRNHNFIGKKLFVTKVPDLFVEEVGLWVANMVGDYKNRKSSYNFSFDKRTRNPAW